MKRIFDLIFSLAVVLFGFPLFLLIALIIKISSKGPVFYAQQRIGYRGREIRCFKFRSMYTNAEKRLEDLLDSNPLLRQEWNTYFKLKNDPRITPIGHFLRKTSLDELPQFFNVILGDLSVVGPRPVTRKEVDTYYKEQASLILSVRPGITGLWQTSGRNLLGFDERVALEARYVNERSLWLDLKLIARTIPVMLRMSGAF